MKREYSDYIRDIINAINKIQEFTHGATFDSFQRDEKSIFAVIRALEVVGEAVKSIPASIKNKYPEIPWKEIAGMRDKLIHGYFGVKIEVVWDTIESEIPDLKPMFEKILKELEPKSDRGEL